MVLKVHLKEPVPSLLKNLFSTIFYPFSCHCLLVTLHSIGIPSDNLTPRNTTAPFLVLPLFALIRRGIPKPYIRVH